VPATGLRTDEPPDQTRDRLDAALDNAGVAETAPLFARLLGLPVDDDVSALEPEAFRRALHDAFRKSLGALAAAKPLVLAIEDIHWIDASSLELTADVARLSRTVPILLLLVGRPEAREQIWAVAEGPATIEVGPFDRDAITRLAEGILGGMVPDELVAFVEQRTSGNPLFVQEMLRALRDEDALVPGGGGWEIRAGWDERRLPATIEGVLAARIDLLPRETAALLQTASVIGRRIRIALLEAVAGNGKLEAPLQQLVRSGFLDRADDGAEQVVIFHHALMQDAAYSRMLRRRRRELHLRVAKVAEQLYGSGDHVIDLLARHLYLGGSPKAVDYLVRAGGRAKRLYANEEAILHFRRAFELAEQKEDFAAQRVELLATLADLQEHVGNYDDALILYTEIIDRWNDVRGWRGSAAVLRKLGRYEEALALLQRAFGDPALRGADLTPVWLEQGWSLSVMGRFDQAIDVLQAGLLAANEARTLVVGHILLQLARAETVEGQLESALERCFVAKAIFDEVGDLRALATTHRVVGDVYRLLGQPEEAADWLRRGLEIAQRVGSVEEIGGCLINLGMVAHERGAFDEAIDCNLRAIVEFERFGHASGRAQGYSNVAWTQSVAGEYDEALRNCEKALELAQAFGLSLIEADVYDTIATIELGKGKFVDAGKQAEKAASLYVELGAMPKAADSLELAAKAWEQAGDETRAADSRTRARDLCAQIA
jgi:adenylate cyclase